MSAAKSLDVATVEAKIAEIIEKHIGVDRAAVLVGTPFVELSSDFDSLALLETQLVLEEEYKFEFDRKTGRTGKLPTNVHELAQLVIAQCAGSDAKQDKAKDLGPAGELDSAPTKTAT
jgi:acyl carrier protein